MNEMKTTRTTSTILEVELSERILENLLSAKDGIEALSSLQGTVGRKTQWADGVLRTLQLAAVDTLLSIEGLDREALNSLLSPFGIEFSEEDFTS